MNKAKIILITILIIPVFNFVASAQMQDNNMNDHMQDGQMQHDSMMNDQSEEMPINQVGKEYEGAIIGKVLLVGENIIRIEEDGSLRTYDINADQDMIENVETGYRVAAMTENGKLTSITVLGMHKDAEPTVYRP